MSEDIEININARMAESLRAFAELNKSVEKVVQKVDALGKETTKTDQIQKRLGDEARRVWERTRTDTEKVSLEQAKLNTLFQKGYIDVQTYARAMGQLSPAAETIGQKMKNWLGTTAGQLIGATTLVGGLMKAIQLANAELDALSRRQERAAQQGLSEGSPIRSMSAALGVRADLTGNQATNLIGSIAADTGADRRAMFEAAAPILSARGSRQASEVLQGELRAVAKLNPSATGDEIGAMGKASLNFRATFGGSTEQALGMLENAQLTSQVDKARMYGDNVVPFLKSMKDLGLSAQDSIARTSLFSNTMSDDEGRISSLAAFQYDMELLQAGKAIDPNFDKLSAKQRDEFFMNDPRGQKIRNQKVGVLSSQLGAVTKKLKSDPGNGMFQGEQKGLMTKIGLLTPGSQQRQLFESILAETPTLDAGDEYYADSLAGKNAITALQPTILSERFRAHNQATLSNVDLQMKGVLEQGLRQSLDNSGGGLQLSRDWIMKQYQLSSAGKSAEGAAEDVIGLLQAEKRTAGVGLGNAIGNTFRPSAWKAQFGFGEEFAGVVAEQRQANLSGADRAHNESIDRLTVELRALIEQMKAGRGASPNGAAPNLRRNP